MVQTAESRHRNHPATWARNSNGLAPCRGLLLQPEVRPVLVVVTDVLAHQTLQMPFVYYDDMIQQVPAAVADEALGDAVLPRVAEAGPLGLDSEALDDADDLSVEVGGAVEYQVLRSRVIREGLAQLLCDPNTARMPGKVAVQDAPPVMGDDEEAIEHAEGQRRHGEEVHRSNRFTVILQERRPSFCRLRDPRRLPHPAQNRPLRNIEAEHLQFAVDAWRTPSSVLCHDAEDEFAQFPTHTSSTRSSAMPRDPLPVQLETGAMPANNCLWLHENQCSLPTRPEPSQHHPEQPVSNPKPGLWMPPFQRSELLPEGEIFEEQVAAKTDGSSSQNKQEPQQAEHGASLTRKIRRNPRHLHLSDLAADHNFGEAQLHVAARPQCSSGSKHLCPDDSTNYAPLRALASRCPPSARSYWSARLSG